MKRRFFLFPSFDGSLYVLKREGENGVTNFDSVSDAIDYAKSCPEGLESKITLYDIHGSDSIEFPVDLPRNRLSLLFMFFQNPGRN
jgi:hypothetical protein